MDLLSLPELLASPSVATPGISSTATPTPAAIQPSRQQTNMASVLSGAPAGYGMPTGPGSAPGLASVLGPTPSGTPEAMTTPPAPTPAQYDPNKEQSLIDKANELLKPTRDALIKAHGEEPENHKASYGLLDKIVMGLAAAYGNNQFQNGGSQAIQTVTGARQRDAEQANELAQQQHTQRVASAERNYQLSSDQANQLLGQAHDVREQGLEDVRAQNQQSFQEHLQQLGFGQDMATRLADQAFQSTESQKSRDFATQQAQQEHAWNLQHDDASRKAASRAWLDDMTAQQSPQGRAAVAYNRALDLGLGQHMANIYHDMALKLSPADLAAKAEAQMKQIDAQYHERAIQQGLQAQRADITKTGAETSNINAETGNRNLAGQKLQGEINGGPGASGDLTDVDKANHAAEIEGWKVQVQNAKADANAAARERAAAEKALSKLKDGQVGYDDARAAVLRAAQRYSKANAAYSTLSTQGPPKIGGGGFTPINPAAQGMSIRPAAKATPKGKVIKTPGGATVTINGG